MADLTPTALADLAGRLNNAADDLSPTGVRTCPGCQWSDDLRDEVAAALRSVAGRAEQRAEAIRREAA